MTDKKKVLDELFSTLKQHFPDMVAEKLEQALNDSICGAVTKYLNMMADISRYEAAVNVIDELVATLGTVLHFIYRKDDDLLQAADAVKHKFDGAIQQCIADRKDGPYDNYLEGDVL